MNTFQTDLLDDATTTGSIVATATTVTFTGRRPRSSKGTSVNATIVILFRGTVLPTSVTIADS